MEPIEFSFTKSNILCFILIIGGIASILTIFLILPLYSLIKLILMLFIIVDTLHMLRLHAYKSHPNSVVSIRQSDKGELICQTRQGRWSKIILSGNSFISLFLIVLIVKNKYKNQTILIPADALTSKDFKTLKTRFYLYKNIYA